jgi:hypothetical protein
MIAAAMERQSLRTDESMDASATVCKLTLAMIVQFPRHATRVTTAATMEWRSIGTTGRDALVYVWMDTRECGAANLRKFVNQLSTAIAMVQQTMPTLVMAVTARVLMDGLLVIPRTLAEFRRRAIPSGTATAMELLWM